MPFPPWMRRGPICAIRSWVPASWSASGQSSLSRTAARSRFSAGSTHESCTRRRPCSSGPHPTSRCSSTSWTNTSAESPTQPRTGSSTPRPGPSHRSSRLPHAPARYRGTCPAATWASAHIRTMSTPGRQGWACPQAPERCPLTQKRAPARGRNPAVVARSNPGRWQLVAGQLLAQSGKSLVRSKRACTGLGGSRLGGVAGGAGVALAGRCSGSVVGSVLGNLLLVGFPAGLGVSVLLLPGGALRLVAFKPLVGLRIEALRVLVVALFVVLCGHAVESRIEFGGVGVDTLVGLLEGQRDTAALEVDVDDLDEQFVANGDNLLGQLNVAHGELGDVDQAFDAVFNANERAERNQLGDLTRNNLAEGVGAGEGLPRVFLRSLERQGNALAVQVHLEDLDGDFLANLDNLGRVVDVLPGQLGNVNQAVYAAQVHEGTEVDDGGNDAGTDLALFQLVEERGADLGLGLLEPCTAGQHNVVAVLVQLDDLGFDLLTDVRSEVAHTAHLDEGCGQEAAQTDVEDKTTLDNLDDGTGDNTVFFLDLLDVAPGTLVLSTLLGEDQAAFFVFLGEHQGFDLIANGDDVSGVNVVLDGQLAGGDDTFGLVTDVEQNFVAVDLDDGTFDEVSVVEVHDGGVDCCEEVLSGTDVVNRDYGGTGLLG